MNKTRLCLKQVLCLVLILLVTACTNAPAASPGSPAAIRSAPLIAAYHGQTSTIFALAWSPDETRLASGGADTIVHLRQAPALCQE